MINKSKGTITRLTSGTAKILATGEISDVCEKKSRSNGVRPNAMKICTFAHSHLGLGKRCWLMKRMMLTAKNDNQKPGEITAIGSIIKMMSAAMANNWLFGIVFRSNSAVMNTVTMIRARWVGIENPASAA